MRHFPIFLNLTDRPVIVSGAGSCAVAKLRLLLKTEAHVLVFGERPNAQVTEWAIAGKIQHFDRAVTSTDVNNAALVYGANENAVEDKRATDLGRAAGALVNIVDNLEDSQFITPAIVDRSPLTVAIGTEGAAPVLARKIKQHLEEALPASLGTLARIGQAFRPVADSIPMGRRRRDFWSKFYFKRGPQALAKGGKAAVAEELDTLLNETLSVSAERGRVCLMGAGPGDPELLTLKARNQLHEADIVIHDQLVAAPILELARREAIVIETGKKGFGASWKQDDINALMIKHAALGHHVVRLKSGDPVIYGRLDDEMDALADAGIVYNIVPGITAASAAAASIGQSLTKRGRNSSLRFLTGHDVNGFAAYDWNELAKPNTTAVIYMGKKASTFLRGRLLMHGASDTTPITIVENASRPDQKILSTTLLGLPDVINSAEVDGPAVIMLGLSPRSALEEIETLNTQETELA
jgi:uroporphyrin-III C-methyltransferase/precorrin-2 dehydrogenase/sirohydrochlorin ferrochelatase